MKFTRSHEFSPVFLHLSPLSPQEKYTTETNPFREQMCRIKRAYEMRRAEQRKIQAIHKTAILSRPGRCFDFRLEREDIPLLSPAIFASLLSLLLSSLLSLLSLLLSPLIETKCPNHTQRERERLKLLFDRLRRNWPAFVAFRDDSFSSLS